MRNELLNKQPNRVKLVFFLILIGCFVSFFITCCITNGISFLSQFYPSDTDTFMDFFNPIKFSTSGDPYYFKDLGATYPPIAYLIFSLIGKFILDSDSLSASELRTTQAGIMVYLIFVIICVIIIFYVVNRFYKAKGYEKVLFLACLLLSSPMLYLIERGNILLLVLALIFIYIAFMDSKNAALRELSLLCLALASAIKLYPAILGLLLLYKKDYRSAFRCIVYGIVFFVVPFFFYDGISTFHAFMNNTNYVIDRYSFYFGSCYGRVDLASVISIPLFLFTNKNAFNVEAIAKILSILISFQFIIGSFLFKEKWQRTLCLTCIMLAIPPYSYAYCIVLYLIPIYLFISKDKFYKFDIFYALFFVMLIIPFPLSNGVIFGHIDKRASLNVLLQNITQLGLFIVLFVHISIKEYKKCKNGFLNMKLNKALQK